MCFHKSRPIPKHLLLTPEPSVYRRRTHRWWQGLLLLMMSVALSGGGALLESKVGLKQNGVTLVGEERQQSVLEKTRNFDGH